MNTRDYHEILNRIFLLNRRPPEVIIRRCTDDVFNYEDDIFISATDEIKHLWVLLEGSVRIHSLSVNGDSSVIAYLNAPQILGLTEYLQNREVFSASVQAYDRCTVLKIPTVQFATMLEEYPDTYKTLAPYLAALATQNMNESESRLILNNRERLGVYLLSLCHSKNLPLRITDTRERIAESTHLNLRTLYRYIDEFCQKGLLTREHSHLVITAKQYDKLNQQFSSLV